MRSVLHWWVYLFHLCLPFWRIHPIQFLCMQEARWCVNRSMVLSSSESDKLNSLKEKTWQCWCVYQCEICYRPDSSVFESFEFDSSAGSSKIIREQYLLFGIERLTEHYTQHWRFRKTTIHEGRRLGILQKQTSFSVISQINLKKFCARS